MSNKCPLARWTSTWRAKPTKAVMRPVCLHLRTETVDHSLHEEVSICFMSSRVQLGVFLKVSSGLQPLECFFPNKFNITNTYMTSSDCSFRGLAFKLNWGKHTACSRAQLTKLRLALDVLKLSKQSIYHAAVAEWLVMVSSTSHG